jgi:hypothetical protein
MERQAMTAREYIEAVAQELGKLRGRGLLLSPADAQLALAWHGGGVPLADVLAEIRRAARLRSGAGAVRGTAETGLSLQLIESAIGARHRQRPRPLAPVARTLAGELLLAARAPKLAARAAWEDLANRADELLSSHGGDRYWTEAIRALRLALRELPREAARNAGAALRERLGPRPAAMSRRRYQRSLQLQLLSASCERLGVPPRPFLL